MIFSGFHDYLMIYIMDDDFPFTTWNHRAFHLTVANQLYKTTLLSDEDHALLTSWVNNYPDCIDFIFDVVWNIMDSRCKVLELHLIPLIILALYHRIQMIPYGESIRIIPIIQFLFECIIESKIFLLPDEKPELIHETVDHSIGLLRVTVPPESKKEKNCCFWFDYIFR